MGPRRPGGGGDSRRTASPVPGARSRSIDAVADRAGCRRQSAHHPHVRRRERHAPVRVSRRQRHARAGQRVPRVRRFDSEARRGVGLLPLGDPAPAGGRHRCGRGARRPARGSRRRSHGVAAIRDALDGRRAAAGPRRGIGVPLVRHDAPGAAVACRTAHAPRADRPALREGARTVQDGAAAPHRAGRLEAAPGPTATR